MPAQLVRSWYISYFQLPFLPERSASWVVPLLWRRWSPGYDAAEDLRHVSAAIGAPDRWRAALSLYRATIRNSTPPARYAELHRWWTELPRVPTLYLHGADDGATLPETTAGKEHHFRGDYLRRVLPGVGHFVPRECPELVLEEILARAHAAPG